MTLTLSRGSEATGVVFAAQWMANCVGHGNYAHFFLMITYLWLGSLYSVRCMGKPSCTGTTALQSNEKLVFTSPSLLCIRKYLKSSFRRGAVHPQGFAELERSFL